MKNKDEKLQDILSTLRDEAYEFMTLITETYELEAGSHCDFKVTLQSKIDKRRYDVQFKITRER